MYCQKCGIQNADDASFCSKCGNNIGKLKSIPIEKTTVEQLPQTKPKKEQSKLWSVLRWFFGIWFGLAGIAEIILGSFGVGILSILISIVILPINKSIAGKSKREYENIDVRELEKNVSKFIDQKIKISGRVDWIEERDGNTFLIIDAFHAKPGFGMAHFPIGRRVYIEYKGSIPILAGRNVVIFGVVKGKRGVNPFIFANSISI
jgi:TM2 domain-containing membrane protein YozV